MVIGIIGENVTGKDYLRMAKSESEAVSLFREKLRKAVSGDNIIYVIADPEHVKLLPDGAIRILVTTDLETIKERFRARMRGNLPAPVALMLERKHGMFDSLCWRESMGCLIQGNMIIVLTEPQGMRSLSV